MRSALIRTVRLISTALAVCLGALPAVPGAPPPHLAPEDLTAAVRFEEDRAAAQLIGTAEDALLRGDHTQAVAILQDVLDSDTAGLVHTSDGYRSALRQTWQLLRSSSPEVIDHYRRHSAGAARAELNAALAGDDDRHLLDVVLRYRFTDAGVSALETLAQRRLDSGRFPEAATLYEELIRGAPDAGQQARRNPAAVRAWILALHESGDDPAALAVAGEFASVIDATGRFGLLLTGLRASQPETSGDSTRKGRDISGWLPSARADWEFTFPADDSIPGDAGAELQEFAAASVAPFLQVRPLEVPDGLVIRTARGVVRLDPRTGQLAWRWTAAAGDSEARLPASGPLASRETRRMLERAFGDSVHTGLAADRERVYFLQQHTDSFGDEPSLSNSLIAVDVETGKELWAHGGGPDAGNLRGVFFRGAPTVYGGELLVVGERATSIELFVLDATNGDLNRSVKLCVPAASPVRDDRRLAQECRVLLTAGKAICPTGGGGLVAVDLISREVGWAYRYPREPVYEDDVSSRSQAQPPRQLVWADSWSAPQLCAAGGRIVLASGESDVLHVLNAHSGALLWTRPRQDELYVGCVTDTHVILVHPHRVSAVRLEDGAVDWSMAMAQPSGRGCVANGRYLLPLLGGGVAAIRLSDGELTRTYSASDSRPHVALDSDIATAAAWRPVTLVRTGDQVTEQSLSAVRRLVNLGEALDSAAEPAPDRERVESAIRHATRLREAGDFRAAADKLLARNGDGLDESERDRLRRFAVDTILTGNWLMNDAPQIGDVEEQLIGSEADRIRFEICRLRSALRDPSPAAIDSALRLVDLGAERYFLEREDGTGWVRLDRQVQAWLGQVLGDVDGPTRLLLDEALTEALQERDARSGDTEAHRVLSWLDHIPAARRLRVQLPPRWSTIGELIRYELELEQLATDDDSTLAAGALAALLKLYEAHSDYRQAARIFLRLQSLAGEDSPAGVIPEIPEDSPLKPYLEGPTLPAWPSREPDVTSAPGVNDDAIYFLHPQIVAECPALVDGLTVSIARNGDRLRFAGGSWSQEWDLELPLVRGPAELMRNDFFADLRRAWMFGNLLVLQVGGNVFGVAPLDRNGEASAELVWPQTAELISAGEGWAQICTHAQSDAPRPHGFAERRLLLDRRLQPVGQVGPVRRGYFCVRRAGELTARQTATGARLWTRNGIPPAARCHGDDDHLVLIRSDSPRVSVLRALDGALISSYDWSLHGAEWLSCFGCRALVLQASADDPSAAAAQAPGLSLTLTDLTTGVSVWSREVSEESVCFPVDESLCGLLEPDGTVRLIELASGNEFAAQRVDRPARLTGVRTMLDPETLFLLLTEPIDDPGIQATIRPDGNSPNTGFRSFEVNGGIHAFERSSGRLRWSRDVDNAVAVLDQPADVPVLVFRELRVDAPGSPLLQNRMRVIEKRTGAILLDETSNTPFSRYAIQRNRRDGWVEIHAPDRIHRFDYGDSGEEEVKSGEEEVKEESP